MPPASTPATLTPTRPGGARRPLAWLPIRQLAPKHRWKITAHLRALGEQDRYLRFGYAATDEQIQRYVTGLDFDRDEIFGVFDRRLQLSAVMHLAHMPASGPGGKAMIEFGVSVAQRLRGRGVGARLFDHALMHARNASVDTMIIHALSENRAMLHIARKAGATVIREGGEAEARLKLPPHSLTTQVEAMVESHAAEIDYRVKRGAHELVQLRNRLLRILR